MVVMKRQILFFILFTGISFNKNWAQDIHWSQFPDNPIYQSPGQAGNFKGDFRFIANYRDQWRSVTVPFQTLSVSADSRIVTKKQKEIGYGLLVFQDVVGDGQLKTLEIQGNVNVFIPLNKDSSFSIRPGINLGMNQRRLNANKFYFDNQFNGVEFDPGLSKNEVFQTDSKTNLSTGIGTVFDWKINSKGKLNSGIGFYNLNRPNQGFFGQTITRDIRTNIFANYEHQLHSDLFLKPSANISLQGKYREVVLGSSIKYILNNQKVVYRAVQGGVWYRLKDAIYFSAGMDYQNWFFGVSYDLNFSKLTQASGARGGIEFAVRYILTSVKPKKIIHRVCPDYI
ncbi:PorP/SprF family type IX secretion system membrane protein [Crocinitomicaceae bacterium]|jgi:type IX secretion system PorP/SprF family membrane protein|nr:PorP/SprF family type IX secretion system membrane protein [Crocinitomicaceae bacterium]